MLILKNYEKNDPFTCIFFTSEQEIYDPNMLGHISLEHYYVETIHFHQFECCVYETAQHIAHDGIMIF